MTTRSQGLSHWSAKSTGPGHFRHHGLAHPLDNPPSPSAHLLFCSLTPCERRTAWKHQSSRKKAPGAILCDLFGMVKWPFQRLSDLQLGDTKVTTWITWTLGTPTNLSRCRFFGGREMCGSFWFTGLCSQGIHRMGGNQCQTFLSWTGKKTHSHKNALKPLRHRNLQWPLQFTANRKSKLPTWNIEILLQLLKVSSCESSPNSDCWPLMLEKKSLIGSWHCSQRRLHRWIFPEPLQMVPVAAQITWWI